MSRLPLGAFEHYVGQGEDRSFEAVARHFGVNKRSVTRAARRERWTERLEEIEREAERRVDQKLTEDLEEMKLRHRKLLRAMASRAAQAIASYPLTDGMQGIKAAELVVKLERILAGEPAERSEQVIRDISRREYEALFEPVAAEGEPGEEDGEGAPEPAPDGAG